MLMRHDKFSVKTELLMQNSYNLPIRGIFWCSYLGEEIYSFPEAGRQVTFLCSAQLELLLQLHNYLSELGPAAAAASHNTAAMFILQIKHTSAVGSSLL